ncbi:GNAT family N-acetyltransferase [Cryptosporangium phraense]|uniref:GNAT family N-acetyltransferase n=1 Tax=Cryptosporangium phraense TaxID=2593070 RepID=A0A545AUP7_9ACTN|nr:GNAT family N-acetyltransferase [Cryptosporangium phraense]TQS45054.1 GNAT family N-acetyltransferase [Cryptosporangium phraense]
MIAVYHVSGDLPELQRVYRAASLSNAGDAPLLLARPEFLVFAGDDIPTGRTRVAADPRILGFATTNDDGADGLSLVDLFVDPEQQRRGIARRLIADITDSARSTGHRHLSVVGNPHALAFYLAVGFTEIGRIATELGPGLYLRRDLTTA